MSIKPLLERAVAVKKQIASADTTKKNELLRAMSAALRAQKADILAANAEDLEAARQTIGEVMLDRLRLTDERIEGMAAGIEAVAELPDPTRRVLKTVTRPNGLRIEKTAVPYGVIGIIYESRPNVTADAAALCLKAGSVCVLRGGKEAICSNKAIVKALRSGAKAVGLDEDIICLVTDTTRDSANELMRAAGYVDLLIPRGGAGLIRACVENALVPCIETGTGICHIYVDAAADLEKAARILENAKTSRPSVCNAAEVCLVHSAVAEQFLPMAEKVLGAHNVELHLCPRAAKIISGIPANEHDFDTEFLDYKMSVRVVDSEEKAIAHIAQHSTHHSDVIITENEAAAAQFVAEVDSAAVYVNASTRFTDGGEFGLGCEMGISTQKMGARGPMGLEEISTYKYIIYGNGQVR
ncbi:glutamate-5-semialdehyde dehydrogenase [Pygmaiobacter massiliensis]|uniref:glutamate-5-semialdehyde dehydrogenase n=1 Tax=Pygmaiobacter massiliensis TaxID=1917873 RepID=UPI000C7A91BC|nr:glutamate-5-semialdehyde dehydrogenase [Pygmaiobacter massiliensis]